jgi:IS605 OrfB family transposase
MANAYAQGKGGTEATTFSLLPRPHGWEVLATRKIPATPRGEHRTAVLAIDLGLRNLMATSEGDIYGRGFLTELRRRDDQLVRLQQGLQGAGQLQLAQCRRYRVFVERLRGWLKTTIQTALARCLDLHRPRVVVVEDLLFAGQPGLLSKRMNRLLRRFGQRYFLQTLTERQQEFGFVLEHVNPAYSSQTCSGCGFVHRGNRDGDQFHCHSCGRRAHADVNAAQNLTRRSGQEATLRAGERRPLRMRALEQWSARLRATLATASPGSMRYHRAVGCARAGLTRLMKEKRPTSLSASESSAWSGLLKELSCSLPGGTVVPSVSDSTRKSV